MTSIRIGAWQTVSSEGGDRVALDGNRIAVCGVARLSVWQDHTRLASADAPSPAPGAPRFLCSRVYWGPGLYDLESGTYQWLENTAPRAQPLQRERCHVYAWSPRGDWILGCFGTGDSAHSVRVTLFNGRSGEKVADLSHGVGLPPQAAWIGEQAAVVGFRDLRVYGLSGEHLADVELHGADIVALDAAIGERRLMVVEQARAIHWIDTAAWSVQESWPGPWLSGAVSPDGQLAAALEPWGKLHFAFLEDGHFKVAGHADADSSAITLALTRTRIATAGGGKLRWADLSVDGHPF